MFTQKRPGPRLRASSPIWASETGLTRTREREATPRGAEAPRSRVLAKLASLAQIGELARRLAWTTLFKRWIALSTG